MARTTRTLAGIALSALLVAACGGGEDASEPTTTTGDVPAAAAALTDSFTGVTAETIKLGYTQIDFDHLRDELKIDLNFQNAEPVLAALVEELNERGGIHGRRVEVAMGTYVPIGAASADEICIKFTEDDPVFAVLGGFGGLTTGVNSCIAARHDTALIGGTWTDDQHAEATAPWLRVDMTLARRSVGFAEALGERGYLEDIDRMAIVSSTAENAPFLPDVEAALEASGVEVVLTATLSGSGGDAEVRTVLERARSDGATAVYYSGLSPTLYPVFAEFGDLRYFFEDATTTEAGLRDFLREGRKLDLVSNGTFPSPYRDDPEMARCIDIVEERTDIEVLDPNSLPDDEPNWWEAVSRACTNLRLFELVATEAGPELTNDSFRAAAERIGDLQLPGIPSASLGKGKYDANDTTSIVEWDPAAQGGEGGWSPVGKPIRVG